MRMVVAKSDHSGKGTSVLEERIPALFEVYCKRTSVEV